MNRRELLACLAAGGVVTATGLWWPGQKLISIPKTHIIGGKPLTIMLTHLGKVAHRWTEMCTVKDGVWDAPDTMIRPLRPMTFDGAVAKSPYPLGPEIIDLGITRRGTPITVDVNGSTLTIQWNARGILWEL